MAPANQCISMFVEALLFRPGWRHLTPGEGGEMNTLLTNPEERTRTLRRGWRRVNYACATIVFEPMHKSQIVP